jgi:cadmium resistance protein CadD (predicted permease)
MVVFAPLLADSSSEIDYLIVSGFIIVAALWFQLASFLSHHAARLELITRLAGWLAPFIMISVGIYILVDTATDVV